MFVVYLTSSSFIHFATGWYMYMITRASATFLAEIGKLYVEDGREHDRMIPVPGTVKLLY